MGVTIKSRQVVVPSEPTWKGIFPLSELDQVGVISHSSGLYFYDRPTHEDWVDQSKNKVINILKDSLSRVLVPFYPLAGRLSWIEGSRLQLDCNAQGVELIEADSSLRISDFGDFVDSSKSMFRDLLGHIDYENTPIQDLPLLSVQVTRFECGGISLGLQTSHVLTDARSAFHFYKEWARLARGEPLELAPYLDRLALKYTSNMVHPDDDDDDNNNNNKNKNNNSNNNCDVEGHVSFAQVAESYVGTGEEAEEEIIEPLFPTIVVMSGERIDTLKKEVNRDEVDTMTCRPYSRFEVITAHLWKCITMARELETDQITSLYVMADGRKRLNPPLPSSYFGNVVAPASASSPVGELISEPLSYACRKVREAIARLTDEYFKETIEFFAKEKNLSNHQFMEDRGDLVGSLKGSQSDMWVTSWFNLLVRGLDFGWGNEIYAGPPTGLSDDGNSQILPHYPDDGSVKIAIWLRHENKSKKFIDLCVGTNSEQ